MCKNDTLIFCMPGVPEEMKYIWREQVSPRLQHIQGDCGILTRTYKVLGIGESIVEEMLSGLLSLSNPTIATYVKKDGIHIQTKAFAKSKSEALNLLDHIEPEIRNVLGNNIYATNDIHISDVVFKLLEKLNLSVSISEDFTCGKVIELLGSRIGTKF